MKIKNVCNLLLDEDYYDYQVYPLAVSFAPTNEEAIVQYIKHCNNPFIEIKEVNVMEVCIRSTQEKLTFYEVKGRNITLNREISAQYVVIDIDYIE